MKLVQVIDKFRKIATFIKENRRINDKKGVDLKGNIEKWHRIMIDVSQRIYMVKRNKLVEPKANDEKNEIMQMFVNNGRAKKNEWNTKLQRKKKCY